VEDSHLESLEASRGRNSYTSHALDTHVDIPSHVERHTSEMNMRGLQAHLSGLKALSLYSGCGGLDLGFVRAGFDIVHAIEEDAVAVATYRSLIGRHVVCSSVDAWTMDMPAPGEVDVVFGGPPCQGFSVAGKMNPRDTRSRHVWLFLDIVEFLQPAAFVMENVKALAVSERWKALRRDLCVRARALGFRVSLEILNASDFGVPQSRERMFLVGVKSEKSPNFTPRSRQGGRTVRNALESLPRFGDLGNDTGGTAAVVPARNPVLRRSPFRGSLLFNGIGRPVELDRPALTLPASMGGNATPILDQEEIDRGAEPWVVGYHRYLVRGGMPHLTSSPRLRRLSVQEAAAIQSFPRGTEWFGTITAQYRQVGNAVPPLLAEAVARGLAQSLLEGKR
jgi:DNA (cytosine-5)-methyltransferase 1